MTPATCPQADETSSTLLGLLGPRCFVVAGLINPIVRFLVHTSLICPRGSPQTRQSRLLRIARPATISTISTSSFLQEDGQRRGQVRAIPHQILSADFEKHSEAERARQRVCKGANRLAAEGDLTRASGVLLDKLSAVSQTSQDADSV